VLRRLRIENLVLIREAELELSPGLNAITGETGAGKTILAQAVGLLLGAKGDAAAIGAAGEEAYVEAELDLPDGFLDAEGLEALSELRPEDEDGLVLARRIFADGRTRAYAWGRSAAREDLAGAGEQLVAMSGQFEQRRLARAAYRLDVLDGFAGDEQRRRRREAQSAWRELAAARRAHDEAARGAADAEARLAELRALAEDTEGLEPGAEDELRDERERLRHVTELAEGAAAAAEALAPDEGDGATGLVAQAERAVAPLESLASELARAGDELRDAGLRLRETALDLRTFLTTLEAEPGRLEQVEAELERIADAKRRFRSASYEELLARAAEARAELARLEAGDDPAAAAAAALALAERRVQELHEALHGARVDAARPFAVAVADELRGMGVGDAFTADLRQREAGPTGTDEVDFLIQPNPGLQPAPLHETASGGELSRIALAIAAVAGGPTMVFDEIDAGIGGETAHAVGATLRRLAGRAQVLTITHLPQIASLADRHFRVEKVPGDPTVTRIQELPAEERREELERMLGGKEFLSTVR
jgi:DNA repair protein RecN (Recombination protein N)